MSKLVLMCNMYPLDVLDVLDLLDLGNQVFHQEPDGVEIGELEIKLPGCKLSDSNRNY